MRLGIGSNARQVMRDMTNRPRRVERELAAAARELAPDLLQAAKEILQAEVYTPAIPRSSTGRPLWQRTGQLIRNVKVRAVGMRIELTTGSDHARSRAALGTAGGRPIRSAGVRSVQWHREAIAVRMIEIRRVRAEHLRRGLRAR